jgi:MazG family protein
MSENYSGSYERLENIMQELREKCPWDKKQTMQSLRKLTIEETYELADAIDKNNLDDVKEELGDLLLHIIFYAHIGAEQNVFSMKDVVAAVCNKLVHRHPHIYAQTKVDNEEDVKRNWESLKIKEGKKTVLGGVPTSLPAMIKAMRLQEKAKQVGFEWENDEQVKDKIDEEWAEFEIEKKANNIEKMESEFGDVLFSMINYARFLDIDPEAALEKTNKKFIRRFNKMETIATEQVEDMSLLSLTELDAIWNTIKTNE